MVLDRVNYPSDVKDLTINQLEILAKELRKKILDVVSKNGGHLAPSFGTIELTLALLKVYDFPQDKVVWDVGHQSYAYKILTGRKDAFDTLRQYKGLSGFNKISESEYDAFTVGHAATSISAALGIAEAREINKEQFKVLAVIGDGSMTSGLAMEGLNNAGNTKSDITVILNDNGMSIAKNVGALSNHLTKVLTNKTYNNMKQEIDKLLGQGFIGNNVKKGVASLKGWLTPGKFFEDFGFRYFGPIDGHNLHELIEVFNNIKNLKGPKLIHIKTTKGKGYEPAEKNASKFHGLGAFNPQTGEVLKNSCDKESFSSVAGKVMLEIAKKHENIAVITAAMPTGTGTKIFGEKYPEKYFDVGIAEGHSVTFAAGMATKNVIPYVFLYSTFLQRAYDNVLHDVALEKLPVVFCIDRAGIVGDDGPTHHGTFDISYLGTIPNITIWAPESLSKLKDMLHKSYDYATKNGPLAIRYPRESMCQLESYEDNSEFELEYSSDFDINNENAILSIGYMANYVGEIKDRIENCDFFTLDKLYPIDEEFFNKIFNSYKNVILVEESVFRGSFSANIVAKYANSSSIKNIITIPDQFVEHGNRNILLENLSLKGDALLNKIESFLR